MEAEAEGAEGGRFRHLEHQPGGALQGMRLLVGRQPLALFMCAVSLYEVILYANGDATLEFRNDF